MAEKEKVEQKAERDVTNDFLLCNRCGTCRYVCPLLSVYREEWAGARGKVELAEAFFRGEKIDDGELRKVFDLCLHCMACEENCPSGMRADEIVMAVRAEMARRGLMPRMKRLALWTLGGADRALFRIMRAFGLVRRAPLHGLGARSPLSFLYPLLGWPRERSIPLPAEKPFLGYAPELSKAHDVDVTLPDPEALRRGAVGARFEGVRASEPLECSDAPFDVTRAAGPGTRPAAPFDGMRAADLVARVATARERNLAAGKRAYFFVGHAVDHFFPEEAHAVTRLLNILGVDVLAPKDQVCCGAPVYYAGDIEGARKAAAQVLEKFEGRSYNWIVTTCSSGGLMLKEEFPRLFDLNYDGYFEITWDPETERFRRNPRPSPTRRKYPMVEDLYREYVEGKVRDVNELVAELLELKEEREAIKGLFVEAEELHGAASVNAPSGAALEALGSSGSRDAMPIVTYHHPCHLKRGQDVDWQPEALLKALPGYIYFPMKDADRCCGGGGAFTFLHDEASSEIGRVKMNAVEAVRPDVVATACPLCRIQLMDMIRRRFLVESKTKGEKPRVIPVKTPPELLLENLERILQVGSADGGYGGPPAQVGPS